MNIPFNTEGNLCHYILQAANGVAQLMSLRELRAVTKETIVDSHTADRKSKWQKVLRKWGHDFPYEAGALIKVYREALRVVNSTNPNPQMLNTPSRCRADQKWLNVNPVHPPTQQPVLAVSHGSLPKSAQAVPPVNLQVMPASQIFPEGAEPPHPYVSERCDAVP